MTCPATASDFLMVKQASANQGAGPQIEIVQHWDEELNRLLPITH